MENLLAAMFVCLCVTTSGVVGDRQFFIAAAEEYWDYMPLGADVVNTEGLKASSAKTGQHGNSHVFKKAIYREYTDETFTTEKHKPAWLGFVGPTLYGEEDEFIKITFFNNASKTFSLHPHGVLYNKINEGAAYADGSHDNNTDTPPDVVEPGCNYTYTWKVTHEASPAEGDADCLTWLYHSHVDTVRDTNSGLVGFLLTCRQGALNNTDLARHYALYVTTVDESKSWYVDHNFGHFPRNISSRDADFRWTSSIHAINGYVFGNLPDITACVGETVTWHMAGLGSVQDLHSLSISGHSFEYYHHRQNTINLDTAQFSTATTTAVSPGRWRISCEVTKHAANGMVAIFDVRKCDRLLYQPTYLSNLRRHYIAAEEIIWDYGPTGRNLFNGDSLTEQGSESEKYFKRDNHHIGGAYKKAVFRAYDDYKFKTKKIQDGRRKHDGFLGPVIRIEVGDLVQVTFKNMASRPYSLHAEGVKFRKNSEGSEYNDGSDAIADNSVPPGGINTYYWTVPEEMGPTDSDPQCLTRIYTSGVNPIKDMYSGLIGPLLVCKRGTLTGRNEQINVEKEFHLLMSVIDENKSWYLEDNMKLAGMDINSTHTRSFTESNLMHSINGLMYGNLEGLDMCAGDRVSWHVLSVGTTVDIHSMYFHGNPFSRIHTHRSTTFLTPGSRRTLYMTPNCAGEWELTCQTDNHFQAGEKTLYRVSRCASSSVQVNAGRGKERVFYIQAEQVDWDYAPTGRDVTYNKPLPSKYEYRQYLKMLYRGYTDASFKTLINGTGEEYLGMLGPVIRVEVGDTLKIVFKNKADRPFSIHPQGLTHNSGGASVPGRLRPDQPAVLPGQVHTYLWKVRNASGPGIADPNCINYPYYSDVNPLRDVNTGLAGALVVCRPGTLGSKGRRLDVEKDFASYLTIVDERQSWLVDKNTERCQGRLGVTATKLGRCAPRSFYVINGYIFGNQPLPTMPQWSVVDWYLMTLGDQNDLHPVHFHGNNIYMYDGKMHTSDVSQLFPGVFSTVRMSAINPGKWLYHCHVNYHLTSGMEGMYEVKRRKMPPDWDEDDKL
ncbi:hephaestin-like protein [Haliotis cracherodii]|uniref:hephaestin-like protein n=1 Tax=Haliotis cracherodii TaxID=6455 RepID=UPI0039E88A0B